MEDRLAALAELREAPDRDDARRELRRALAGSQPHLARMAARLAGEMGMDELAEDLSRAFDRFMIDPAERDKGCVAKTAIVEALAALEEPAIEVFRRGARHVQLEGAYGGPVDAAAELRARSLLGLVDAGYPEVTLELADGLADAESAVRAAAARGLGARSPLEAEPVLRLKALTGDTDSEALTECFLALLDLAPERSLEFVDGILAGRGQVAAEAAALALGESRLDEAVPILCRHTERPVAAELQRTLMVALAVSRRQEALDFLLAQAADAPASRAADAVVALAIHRHDEQWVERVAAAVAARPGDSEVQRAFARKFRG